MSALNVLFISHASSIGGAQNILLSILETVDREKINPIVLLPQRGALERKLESLKIEYSIREIPWWISKTQKPNICRFEFSHRLSSRISSLCLLIRQKNIQLVYTNTLVCLDGAIAADHCKIPHVWHVHEMIESDAGLRPLFELKMVAGHYLERCTSVPCVSKSVVDQLAKLAPTAPLQVIYNGISPSSKENTGSLHKEFGLPPTEKIVIFLGFLSARKGVHDLLSAARRILELRNDTSFIFAGPDGGEEKSIRTSLEKFGLQKKIILTGFRRDAHNLLSNSDVFVLPSHADPLPTAVLEAMHLSKPVVATKSGGCTEMVVDGETGFLVDVADIDALSDRIQRLIDDSNLRSEFGKAGRERARRLFNRANFGTSITNLIISSATCGVHKDRSSSKPLENQLSLTPALGLKERITRRFWRVRDCIRGLQDSRA